MNKLALIAAGTILLANAACSKSAEKSGNDEANLATKIENCTNPDSLKIYVDEAKAHAQHLIDEGKLEEAKQYLEKIESAIKEKAPTLTSILSSVKSALGQIPEAVENSADSLKSEASEKTDSVVDKVKGRVATGVESVKAKSAEKFEEIKAKASEKTSDTKEKVKEFFN